MTLHFNQVECPSKSFAAKLNYSLLLLPRQLQTFLSVNFTKGIGHEQSSLEDAHHHLMSGVRKNNVAIAHYTLRYVSYLESENGSSKLSVFLLYIKQSVIQK